MAEPEPTLRYYARRYGRVRTTQPRNQFNLFFCQPKSRRCAMSEAPPLDDGTVRLAPCQACFKCSCEINFRIPGHTFKSVARWEGSRTGKGEQLQGQPPPF